MTKRKQHQNMDKLDSCYKLVEQSSAKGGIRAIEIGNKMDVHRTTAHKYLTSLELMGKVYSDQGFWKTKTGETTIKPLEKEIVIKLPLQGDDWRKLALLEHFARDWEKSFPNDRDNPYRITLDAFNETRTIKITGKNVDDIEFQEMTKLIEQANETISKFDLKRMLKRLKF